MILLKEDGVCDLPELQGNLEYIPFNGNNLQEPFLKISQMISDIKTTDRGGVTEKSSERLSKPEETEPEEQKGQPKEEVKNKKQEVLNKVYFALFSEKDYNKAQKIFNEEAETLLDEDEKIPLRAFVLRFSHAIGDYSAFDKLLKLVKENGDNPRVITNLAYRYKDMGEFNKAKEYFLLATKKYDVNDADNKSSLVNAYVQAAWCLANDDDLNSALVMLQKLLFNPDFQDSKAQIFKAMAEISKKKNEIERFVTVHRKIL